MRIELWAGLAAFFFALAGVGGGLQRFGIRGPWRWLTLAARAAGLVFLAVDLSLVVVAHGEPSPFDLQQLALALALALSGISLALTLRRGAAGLVQDLLVLALVLAAMLAIRPGGPLLSCLQRSPVFLSYWGLFVLGSGSALLAGSAALDLALQAALPGGESPSPAGLRGLLAGATLGALVTLGAGLTTSLWWAWHMLGSLSDGDPRQVWLAATWLVAGSSLLAWQWERHSVRLAAGLALLAAVMALFGLLAIPELQRLWSV